MNVRRADPFGSDRTNGTHCGPPSKNGMSKGTSEQMSFGSASVGVHGQPRIGPLSQMWGKSGWRTSGGTSAAAKTEAEQLKHTTEAATAATKACFISCISRVGGSPLTALCFVRFVAWKGGHCEARSAGWERHRDALCGLVGEDTGSSSNHVD